MNLVEFCRYLDTCKLTSSIETDFSCTMEWRDLPVLDEGVWAEIKAEGHHLRLFSEHSALGVHASVYDVANKRWIAPSEPVDSIEEGKEKAIEHARNYLSPTGIEFPVLNWKRARSV